MATSKQSTIIVSAVVWHFYDAPRFLLLVWKNYINFALDFFSIPLLLKTLFSPWKRYRWGFGKQFSIGQYFNVIVSNIFSRLIGAVCRIVLIMVGIGFLAVVLIGGLITLLLWLSIPFIIVFLTWLLYVF